MMFLAETITTKAQEGVKIRIIQEDAKEEEVLKEEEVKTYLINQTSNAIIAISMDALRDSVDRNKV